MPSFVEDQNKWRAEREALLKRPNGWLAVAGLFWVKEGSQTLGSSDQSDIIFPKSAPSKIGTITLANDIVTIQPEPGVVLTRNDKPLEGPIKTDKNGAADKIHLGDLTFSVIVRGTRTGIRLWDPNCKGRTEFKGCKWFAPDPAYVVKAKWVPHNPVRTIPILNILGDTEQSSNPGYVEFTLGGATHRLEAIGEGNELFFNFKDATSGKETYGAGRFMYADLPKDGIVTLDFNKAYNPPCAFTNFATCPLPPKGNALKAKISAGELVHHPIE